jgi:ureidoglycolate hydrolase
MSLKSLTVEALTAEAFAPFGTLVDWTPELDQTGQPFHIVVKSKAPTGWRMAMLKVAERAIEYLENHPQSEELFAPVQGRAVLVVAKQGEFDEDGVHAFFLDRPVSVGPAVWHGVFTLSAYATILIAENLEVGDEYAKLSGPVGATLE